MVSKDSRRRGRKLVDLNLAPPPLDETRGPTRIEQVLQCSGRAPRKTLCMKRQRQHSLRRDDDEQRRALCDT